MKFPETNAAFEEFLELKQGEPKQAFKTKPENQNRKRFSLVRRLSINPRDETIQIEENYEEEVVEKKKEIAKRKMRKNCPLCKKRPVKTYHHGPGVCHADRVFFINYFPKKDTLKCRHKRSCLKSQAFMDCQACRLEKCINIGMKWRGLKTRSKKSKNEILDKRPCTDVVPLGPRCISCSRTNAVGRHYGLSMCSSCMNWYCKLRNNKAKQEALRCTEIIEAKKYKCAESIDFVPRQCSKCRFDKINKLVLY